jgi:uncharacterized protein YegP (UPF0339 family)
MDKETTAAFDRRATLVRGLSSGTLLVDAAYRQFKLDYAAAQRPALSVAPLAVAGEGAPDGGSCDPAPLLIAAPAEMLHFELSLAERVRLTSTRSAGGEWSWRLCTASGTVIARGGGYRTEDECRSAIALVQRAAGQAPIKDR